MSGGMMTPYLADVSVDHDAPDVVQLSGGPCSLPVDPDPSPTPPDLPRWHMKGGCPPNGDHCPKSYTNHHHIYIMYGNLPAVERLAARLGYFDIEPSGHFSHVTGMIVGARDGETSFTDVRKSGGGSRG